MTTQVPEWKFLIIAIGVSFLLLYKLDGFITVNPKVLAQRSGWKQPLEYSTTCPNGTKTCLPRGYLVSPVVRDGYEHGALQESKTKVVPKKLKKRKKAKRDKQAHHERRKGTDKAIKIPNKDFIAWHIHADIRIYMPDTQEHGDPNMSEEESLNQSNTTKDVKEKREKDSTKLPPDERPSLQLMQSPQIEANIGLGHFSLHPPSPDQHIEKSDNTGEIFFYVVVGVIIGFTLRHLSGRSSLMRLIYNMGAKTWMKKLRGYKRLEDTDEPQIDVDSNLNLSMLPPHLEDLLAMMLDVRLKGRGSFGWQKVGAEFKVSKVILDYLAVEYERENGSPTIKLLYILGAGGKTISELVDVLKSRKVKRRDIANLIRLT